MRLLLLAAIVIPVLQAQNFRGQIKLKPLLPPLSQTWGPPAQAPALPRQIIVEMPAAAEALRCSIPLINTVPGDVDAGMQTTPHLAESRMPAGTPPR